MAQIKVSLVSINPEANPKQFQVEVIDVDGTKSIHQVTLTQELYVRLTGGLEPPEELVKSSFEFLLEREPKESILPTFDLAEIQKYFPEYETLISSQLTK